MMIRINTLKAENEELKVQNQQIDVLKKHIEKLLDVGKEFSTKQILQEKQIQNYERFQQVSNETLQEKLKEVENLKIQYQNQIKENLQLDI